MSWLTSIDSSIDSESEPPLGNRGLEMRHDQCASSLAALNEPDQSVDCLTESLPHLREGYREGWY